MKAAKTAFTPSALTFFKQAMFKREQRQKTPRLGAKTQTHLMLRLCMLTLCLLLSYGIIHKATAQTLETETVWLSETTKPVFIGPQSYLTTDPKNNLSVQNIIRRHQNNLRGEKQKTDMINLGPHQQNVWLVFTIQNNSPQENWVLDFGNVKDGRNLWLKRLTVADKSAQNIITVNANKRELYKNAISLNIPKDSKQLVVIGLERSGLLPATFTPSLTTQTLYFKTVNEPDLLSSLYLIVLILSGGFITALAVLKKNYGLGIFTLYLLIQLALYKILESALLVENTLLAITPALLLFIALSMKWMASWLFFENAPQPEKIMPAFIITSAMILSGLVTSILLPAKFAAIANGIIYLSCIAGTLTGATFSIALAWNQRREGLFLAMSWLGLCTGILIMGALNFELIQPSITKAHFYWLALLFETITFSYALILKIRLDDEEEQQKRAREKRAAQSMARLQQSKETSDQARLLRVIERERELMAELREREMQRTEEMRKAKNMADEANRAKSAFLAVVSHEVRTPMNGIMGMIRLLNDTQMTRQQTEYLHTMQTSGETMMALLNDILDFEKIESGNMELEIIDFDFKKLIQDVVTLMSGHAAEKDNNLIPNISPTFPASLKGDPTRLRQVLLNLVNNAIKFTEKGTVTIALSASPEEKDGKQFYKILCSVEDTGIGISQKAQETLFKPFTQADSSTARKYGGTGLGLTICKRLIDAMNGSITLKSQEGVGSTFSFTLTLETGESQNTRKTPTHRANNKAAPMNILIIDDNEMNRKVLKGFLEKDGHNASSCAHAEQALELCSQRRFDAIITDIRLGGMDGMEFTRNLRIFPNKTIAATPVIALSGNVSKEDIQNCYDANINGFLSKPIDPQALEQALLKVQDKNLDNPVLLPGNTSSQTQNAPTRAIQKDPVAAPAEEMHKETQPQSYSTFNPALLESLAESLPPAQIAALMKSFTDKSDEILADLQRAAETKDTQIFYDKGHELKGMAANFGLTALSKLGATIEHAGKEQKIEEALTAINQLAECNTQSKMEIKAWMESLR
ncbi:MAG: response regulator [Alphaproteobacteria bacterium]|nr:response regulator [Alphaproteobacteria bacterium]